MLYSDNKKKFIYFPRYAHELNQPLTNDSLLLKLFDTLYCFDLKSFCVRESFHRSVNNDNVNSI